MTARRTSWSAQGDRRGIGMDDRLAHEERHETQDLDHDERHDGVDDALGRQEAMPFRHGGQARLNLAGGELRSDDQYPQHADGQLR